MIKPSQDATRTTTAASRSASDFIPLKKSKLRQGRDKDSHPTFAELNRFATIKKSTLTFRSNFPIRIKRFQKFSVRLLRRSTKPQIPLT
jgi:hypothetical protein